MTPSSIRISPNRRVRYDYHGMMFGLCSMLLLNVCALSVSSTCRYLSDVTQWLDTERVPWEIVSEVPKEFQHATTVFVHLVGHANVTLHLIPTPHGPRDCLPMYHTKNMADHPVGWLNNNSIIHLHQDVWLGKSAIVKCRLLARLGRSRRIFARKTRGCRIDAACAMEFLSHHHLWGATKAKYYYGLFYQEELVAVATYSSRRKVVRDGFPYRSHEMIRYCSQRDCHVVGGISKLNKVFIVEAQPDDIITVVDRDWGPASLGWHNLGFSTVHIMDPIVMVVSPQEPGLRRQLVGAGIRHDHAAKSSRRLGLPLLVYHQLQSSQTKHQSFNILSQHGFFPVHDAGVERLMMLVPKATQKGVSINPGWLWNHSKPTYAPIYYSNNTGIAAMLKRHESDDSSRSPHSSS